VFDCNLKQLDGLTVTMQQNRSSDLILKDVPKKEWSDKGKICNKASYVIVTIDKCHPQIIVKQVGLYGNCDVYIPL